MMNIIIKTKNLEVTDYLEALIHKKMAGLDKFLKILEKPSADVKKGQKGKTLSEVFFEVERESNHHKKGDIFKAEATIHLPGKSLMAKSHGEDLANVIIEVRNGLEREIRKYKTKLIEFPRRKSKKQII